MEDTATASPIQRSLPVASPRDGFARRALVLIPSLLGRQDRDPHSPTYGCFDPDYWHRRSIDFPSGSAAEAVLPLALAYSLEIPGNLFHRKRALRHWVEAGILYAARSTHPDGSCDECFPFEKSVPAAASSLLACLDAYSILGLNNTEMLQFFARRADWLASQKDRSRDATPLALTVLALEKAARLLGTERWARAKTDRLEKLLRSQNDEGWFPENDGADPSSQTLIVGLLAQLHQLAPSHELRIALTAGIQFAADFVHPDGSFGGEYGTVGATGLFPHGFEIAGHWLPEALAVNDQFLKGLPMSPDARDGDHRLLARRCWSFLLAWQDWVEARPPVGPRPTGRRYFKKAGLLIDRRDGCELYVGLNRGGIFKLWRDGRLIASDTQLSVQTHTKHHFATAIADQVGHHKIQLDGHAIRIRGKLVIASRTRMTTPGIVLRRVAMGTIGKVLPRLARNGCGRHLVPHLKTAPFRFNRSLVWSNGRLHVTDELEATHGWTATLSVGIGAFRSGGCAQPTRGFHVGQLQHWQDFTEQMHQLKPGEPLKIEREL
ncbi:MAG: hypothetical protein ABMA01_14895 [Chthoniobacteraceae bacterium]